MANILLSVSIAVGFFDVCVCVRPSSKQQKQRVHFFFCRSFIAFNERFKKLFWFNRLARLKGTSSSSDLALILLLLYMSAGNSWLCGFEEHIRVEAQRWLRSHLEGVWIDHRGSVYDVISHDDKSLEVWSLWPDGWRLKRRRISLCDGQGEGTTARWEEGSGRDLRAVCYGRLEWQRRSSAHAHTLIWYKLS